jgi:TctA family transporter
MSYLELYLLTRMQGFHELFGNISLVTLFLLFLLLLWASIAEVLDKAKTWLIILFAASCISGLICVSIPTNKDLAIILAGRWATNSAEVQKLPENVVGVMNKFMNQYLQEPSSIVEKK